MSASPTTAIVMLKTLTLVLGSFITYFAYKASRRTGSSSLRVLALGFGVVTIGAMIAGIVDQILPLDPSLALALESLFTVVGFGIILFSLYAE